MGCVRICMDMLHKVPGLLAVALLLCLLAPSPVSRAATGGAVKVPDFMKTVTARSGLNNQYVTVLNKEYPARTGVEQPFSFSLSLFTIPDTSLDVTYTVRLKIKDLSYSLWSYADSYSLPNTNLVSFTFRSDTQELFYKLFTFSELEEGTGEISFDVEGLEDSTPISFYTSTVGTAIFSHPALSKDEVYNVPLCDASLTFYDVSYEAQVGSDDVLSAVEKQTEVIQDSFDNLTGGYENPSASSSAGSLDGSFSGLTSNIDSVTGDADKNLAEFGFDSIVDFSAGLVSALSLVGQFEALFFTVSRDLTVAVTTLYALVFLSIVVGLWRFFRK